LAGCASGTPEGDAGTTGVAVCTPGGPVLGDEGAVSTPGGPLGLVGSVAKEPGGPEPALHVAALAMKKPGGPWLLVLSLEFSPIEAMKKFASTQKTASGEAKTPGGADRPKALERGDISLSLSSSTSDIAAQESALSPEMHRSFPKLAAVEALSLTSLAVSVSVANFSASGASAQRSRDGGCDSVRRRQPVEDS